MSLVFEEFKKLFGEILNSYLSKVKSLVMLVQGQTENQGIIEKIFEHQEEFINTLNSINEEFLENIEKTMTKEYFVNCKQEIKTAKEISFVNIVSETIVLIDEEYIYTYNFVDLIREPNTDHTNSIYSISTKKKIKVLENGKIFKVKCDLPDMLLYDFNKKVTYTAYSKKLNLLCCFFTDKSLRILNVSSQEASRAVYCHNKLIIGIALSEETLVTGSNDGTFAMYNIKTLAELNRIYIGTRVVCVECRENLIGVADDEKNAYIFNLKKAKKIANFKQDDDITCLCIFQNNECLVIGFEKGCISICNIATGDVLKKLLAHNKPITKIMGFHNSLLITVSNDLYIKSWGISDSFV